MAATLQSSPNLLNKLSDPLLFKFSMSEVSSDDTIRRFGYRIVKVVDGNDLPITPDLDYTPRKAGEAFPIYINTEAYNALGVNVPPSIGGSVPSSGLATHVDKAMCASLKVVYWQINYHIFTQISEVTEEQSSPVIKVFNCINEPYQSEVITAGYIFGNRPCITVASKDADDFIFGYGAFSVVITGYDRLRDPITQTISQSSSGVAADVSAINVGPRSVVAQIPDVFKYRVVITSAEGEKTLWYEVNYSEDAEVVVFLDKGGAWHEFTFDYKRGGNVQTSRTSLNRIDRSQAINSSRNRRITTTYTSAIEENGDITLIKRFVQPVENQQEWVKSLIKSKAILYKHRGQYMMMTLGDITQNTDSDNGIFNLGITLQFSPNITQQNAFITA